MAAAGNTSAQAKVISWEPTSVRKATVTSAPVDNIYEGNPVYVNSSGNADTATATNKAFGIALTPCTWDEAGGTFGANGNYGQQTISIAPICVIKKVSSGDWTINGAVYVDANGTLTQTADSNHKIGVAVAAKIAFIRCGVANF